MQDKVPKVIKIPARPAAVQNERRKQLRVAAYCRVSTQQEDQANSYEVQKEYYTEKIISNTAWTMAGIYADKGVTGTSAKKRDEFMRMIRHCRQHKIDIVLTKSVSRFSRNTVDCLYYIQYKYLYAYRRGPDNKPEIIPEEAEVVRWIYDRYLSGASLRMIKDELAQQGVGCEGGWTAIKVSRILKNEKYCGDVLMQKTFRQDFINRKVIKNTGQRPMYLIENYHEGIVSREKFNEVQAELARRKAAKSPSKLAVTGRSCYASKYALSERLICGECGTLYRRCTWMRQNRKKIVWRCVSRLEYGKKYCHNSPTMEERPLQQAILAAINSVMADKKSLIQQITDAMEVELQPAYGSGLSIGGIERRLAELETQFQRLLEQASDDPAAYSEQFKAILDEQTSLKERRAAICAEDKAQAETARRIKRAAEAMQSASPYLTEWDEIIIHQLVEQVKVISKYEVSVMLKGGIEIHQNVTDE